MWAFKKFTVHLKISSIVFSNLNVFIRANYYVHCSCFIIKKLNIWCFLNRVAFKNVDKERYFGTITAYSVIYLDAGASIQPTPSLTLPLMLLTRSRHIWGTNLQHDRVYRYSCWICDAVACCRCKGTDWLMFMRVLALGNIRSAAASIWKVP